MKIQAMMRCRPGTEGGPGPVRTLARALAALLGGLVGGIVLTLGVVVARARLQRVFLHELGEVVGWTGLGLVLAPAVALWVALARPRRLASTGAGAGLGLVGGACLGVVLGALASADPAWTWAGGTMGGAAGLLLGALGGVLRRSLRERGGGGGARRNGAAGTTAAARVASLVSLGALGAIGCGDAVESALPPPGRFAEPVPEEVESVVFLLGDPGLATLDRWPILPRLRADVERWAGALEADSSVVVLVLGDVVYPDGVAPRDAPGFAEDSSRVADQVALVTGPRARSRHARLHFLAGNHDWGNGRPRVERLRNLAALVRELRSRTGAWIGLEPGAGTGGPAVVDVGKGLRLVLLDTAWWLLEGEGAARARDEVIRGVRRALRSAGERHVVVAAHHPFESAGPHGALDTFGSTLGIRTLLSRSGALLQDLHSGPYRELRRRLRAVFAAEGRPAVFAGGHEHSLQVIRREGQDAPALSLVSGSGSKLTPVGTTRGLAFGRSVPGYARLFVLRDGTLELELQAAPARYLECRGTEAERGSCMDEGVDAFRTVWSGNMAIPSAGGATRRPSRHDTASSGRPPYSLRSTSMGSTRVARREAGAPGP